MIEKFKVPDTWAKLAIVVVLGAGAVGAVRPRAWRVEQSVTIAAPPERIHAFVDDLKRWQEWSVWTKALDPSVRHIYEGQPSGVGARWTWLGPKMGQGTVEIVESSPALGLGLSQAIESPTPNARATLRYAREGNQTRVTWVDEGTLPVVVGGFFRGVVEERLAAHLATSLGKLKGVVEAAEPVPVAPVVPAVLDAPDAGTP